jgi:Zn-dependent protease with chaperone function
MPARYGVPARRRVDATLAREPGDAVGQPIIACLLFTALIALPVAGFARTVAGEGTYSADELRQAADRRLERELRGRLHPLDRESAEAKRVFDRVVAAALQRFPQARALEWALYLPDDRRPLVYSTSHGKVVLSTGFLERYAPDDAQLALVIGHEVAHVLCGHEASRLTAVRALGGGNLAALHAIELLETEPWAAEALVPLQREQERVADRLGQRLAMQAGYAPDRALAFFDSLACLDRRRSIGADEHDAPAARRRALEREVARPSAKMLTQREGLCETRSASSASTVRAHSATRTLGALAAKGSAGR